MKLKFILLIMMIIILSSSYRVCVEASETTKSTEDVTYDYTMSIYMTNVDYRRFRIDVDYSTDGTYYLMFYLSVSDSLTLTVNNGYFGFYNPVSGDAFTITPSNVLPSGITINSITLYESYDEGVTYRLINEGNIILTTSRSNLISVGSSILPIYLFNSADYSIEDDFHAMYVSDQLKLYAGYDYWNTGNRYDYESVYSSSVVTPEVRFAMVGYNGSDFLVQIKYLLPDLQDNSDYYTELWADIPTGFDSNGNVVYQKVMLGMYSAADIYKQNIIQEWDSVLNSWVPANKGAFYEIYGNWNSIIPYITAIDSIQYGGVILYLRSSVPVSDTKTMVSDYVYFTLNPDDIEHTDEGWVSSMPDIYKGDHSNFDEGGAGNNNPTDSFITNSNDYEYVGGVTDDPGISSDSSSSTGNGKWKYTYTGNWTIGEFENWVNDGFGLTGENGLLVLIGNLFFFLPSEFMSFLFWLIVGIGVYALINLLT